MRRIQCFPFWGFVSAILLPVIFFYSDPAAGQQRETRESVNAGTVSILTDGLSTSTGRGSKAIMALARSVSDVGKLRVLAIAGEGGHQNLRDLLLLKGIDFAILNSDVLTHQEHFGPYRNARSQTKLVTKLFDQRIVLFARPDIPDVRALEGRTIGVIGDAGPGRLTAETIFKLLGINIRLVSVAPEPVAAGAEGETFDGLLVLEEELANGAISQDRLADLTPLSIPMTPELAQTYERGRIERNFPYGRAPRHDIATLRSATVLAAFNWPATAARYGDVVKLIEALFKGIVDLRRSPSGELWRQVAATEAVPGWQRYGAAVASRWLDQKDVTQVATVTPTRLVEVPEVAAALARGGERERTGAGRLKVLIAERPPFHGRELEDGGILTALLRNSVAGVDREIDIDWVDVGSDAALKALAELRHDVFLSSETIPCDQPSGLTRLAAFLCDETMPTGAFMPVVIGLFVPKASKITAIDRATTEPLRVCLAEGRPVAKLEQIKSRPVRIMREADLALCAGRVQRGEADAFAANELSGRFLLRRLGVDGDFRMLEQPIDTQSMHGRVLRARSGSDALVGQINDGLKRIKQSDVYGAVVRNHVMAIWGGARPIKR